MRLHVLVPIAALLLASPALAQPKRPTTPEERLDADLAALKRNQPNAASLRYRIYQTVKKVSDKAKARRALLDVARSYDWKTPHERLLGTRDLRQLNLRPASEAFRQEVYQEIQARLGWNFAHVTNYGRQRHGVEAQVSRAGRPASALSVFKLRNEDLLAAALRGEGPTRIPRKRWEPLAIGSLDAQPPRTHPRSAEQDLVRADLLLPRQPGVYLLEEVIEGFRHLQGIWIQESQLVVHVLRGQALVYVIDPVSGEPKPGVAVSLVSEKGRVDAKTDASGLARLPCGAKGQVIAQPGSDVLLCRFETQTREPGELVYLTTDRPVYRPGQTVHFKAVCRKEGNTLPAREPVKVDVRDPLGRIVWQGELPWSAQGTLSGAFTLAAEPGLGDYSVVVHVPRKEPASGGSLHFDDDDDDELKVWTKTFTVLAYRKPAAKISIEVLAPTQPGGLATAVLRAEYFHGGPVVDGEVSWRVTEGWEGWKARPGLLEPRPPFEDPLAWLYAADDARYEAENDYSYDEDEEGEEILEGTGRTGPDGTLRLRFPTRSGGLWPRSYQVHAEVSDESRLESEVSSPRLTLEASSLQIEVGPRRLFEVPGEPVQIGVRLRNAEGESPGKQEVTLVTYRTPSAFADSLEFESVSTQTATSDAEGLVWFTVPAQAAGRLRFVARAKDAEGRVATARCGTWVAGDAAVAPPSESHRAYYCADCDQNYAQPFAMGCLQCQGPLTLEHSQLPEPNLSILGQQLAYREGDTARFLVRAPSVPLTCLLTVEGEGFLVSKVLRLTERSTLLELPVGKDWAPNVLVKLKGWRNYQSIADGARVVVLAGGADVQVTLSTDRPSYSPGEKAQLVVTTTRDGAPVAGEVELAVVDEKILQLRADETPDLRGFFRRLRTIETHVTSTGDALDTWRRLSERGALDHGGLMFGGGGGGGAGGGSFSFEEADESESASPEGGAFAAPRFRRRFPDTLFYRAHVVTGPDGRAVVPVDMADELTRWRVLARAVVGAEGFGQAEATFRTRQDVVLKLATPRFMVEGDLATVATVVHNSTGEAARFTVVLESPLAKVQGGPRTVVVPAGASAKLDWEVIALQPGPALFKARAVSKRGSDALELEVPIKAFGTPQVRLQSGEVKAGEWQATLLLPKDADPERAVLDLSVAGGPMAAIEQALPFLAGFPYGCVEQTMSRFLPAVVASAALERTGGRNERLKRDLPVMVNAGLQRLYGFQHDDGGWGWWKHDETDPRMTTYVLFGLLRAKAAGIKIDARVLEEGLDCLRDLEPTAFGLYVRVLSGEKVLEELRQVYPETQAEFAYLVMAGRLDLLKELTLSPPKGEGVEDLVEASLVLRALVGTLGRKERRVKELTTWLLARRKGPKWHTTLDTAYAILALSEVVEQGAATQVRSLRVNGKEVPSALIKDGRVTLPKGWVKPGANRVALQTARGVRAFASARLNFLTHADPIPAQDSPALKVRREVQIASGRGDDMEWRTLEDGATVRRRDRVRVKVTIVATRPVSYSLVESPLPAGAVGWSGAEADQDYEWWDDTWYQRREFRDDRVSVCGRELDEGESEVIHHLRFTHPGSFRLLPARAEGMYDPLAVGTSRSFTLKVVD